MKIGIIGYGFVGKALKKGLKKNVDVLKIDPKLNTTISDLENFNPDILFICVPTPMNKDLSQDISILTEVLNQIKLIKTNALVVLKSTVLPNNIEAINRIFPDFIYNPEFLREKHAEEDFINSTLIIFGGSDKDSIKRLEEFYLNYTKCLNTNYFLTDAIAASFIKYSINSFLATKVTFFNELNNLFLDSNSKENWVNLTKAISKDERIGSSHMNVPGHDGRKGFGGACLPKDANAFFHYSKNQAKPLNLLKNVININNEIRKLYNTETQRELDQNIKFTGENT
tara:strand:- start:14 stop:865 length:852 start_codon:yes stop_codon:yes gene_type:complete